MKKNGKPRKEPFGRPTTYKPEYCQLLLEHMDRGMSFESFAGHPKVGVSRATLYQWKEDNKDFSDAHDQGRMKLLYNLENFTVTSVSDAETYKINTGLHIFRLKNQIGWKEKSEQEVTNKVTLTDLVVKSGESESGSDK